MLKGADCILWLSDADGGAVETRAPDTAGSQAWENTRGLDWGEPWRPVSRRMASEGGVKLWPF